MINKLYTLSEIDITEWHRANMPDRIAYVTDDSTGRKGCGCYLVKLNDNLYSGFVCDKHLRLLKDHSQNRDMIYSLVSTK